MGLLDTIRSILGLDGDGSDRGEQVERRTTDVRVERDPDESTGIDATSEAAVKGTDDSPEHDGSDEPDEAATAGTDAVASTDSLTEEPPEPDAATEPTEPAEGTAVTDEPDADVEPEDAAPEPSAEMDVAESGPAEETDPAATADEPAGDTEAAEGTEPDTTAEPAEDGAADDGVGDEPVKSISGIGQAYGKRLSDAGVETVADLAAADSAELADDSGISEKRITDWQEAADDRLA